MTHAISQIARQLSRQGHHHMNPEHLPVIVALNESTMVSAWHSWN